MPLDLPPLTWLFAAALVVQLGYVVLLARGLRRVREAAEGPEVEPEEATESPSSGTRALSAVVAARDEEANLPALIAALQAQTHPAFEVVIVDDRSTDGTADLVRAAAARDPRFRLVQVPQGETSALPPKKHALTQGLKAAQHPHVALTDADCTPPPTWLATIAEHIGRDPEAVWVGYGPYRAYPGWLNAFVRYETVVTALMGAAGIGLGRPLWAVGRNLAYPRDLFERVGGFAHSAASLSGDDDLLVQEVARRDLAPVRYLLDARAFVPSEPPRSLKAWARQKLRHTSAGAHYRPGVQAHLLAFHASNALVWVGAPVLLALGSPVGLGLLAARLLAFRAVVKRAFIAFGVTDLTLKQPALDALYLLYNTVWAPLGVVWKPKGWQRGRGS